MSNNFSDFLVWNQIPRKKQTQLKKAHLFIYYTNHSQLILVLAFINIDFNAESTIVTSINGSQARCSFKFPSITYLAVYKLNWHTNAQRNWTQSQSWRLFRLHKAIFIRISVYERVWKWYNCRIFLLLFCLFVGFVTKTLFFLLNAS